MELFHKLMAETLEVESVQAKTLGVDVHVWEGSQIRILRQCAVNAACEIDPNSCAHLALRKEIRWRLFFSQPWVNNATIVKMQSAESLLGFHNVCCRRSLQKSHCDNQTSDPGKANWPAKKLHGCQRTYVDTLAQSISGSNAPWNPLQLSPMNHQWISIPSWIPNDCN